MKISIILISCVVGCLLGQDIENADLTLTVNGTEVILTIPGDPKVQSIFFSTEFGDKCSLVYTFEKNNKNSQLWTYKQNLTKELQNNDELRVLGVFQKEKELIRKTYDYKIDGRTGVKQEVPENVRDCCECTKSNTEWDGFHGCSGDLIFQEEFNYKDGNVGKWIHEIRAMMMAKYMNEEMGVYVNNRKNSYVKDGILYLNATWLGNEVSKFTLKDCTSTHNPEKSEDGYKKECGPFIRKWGSTFPACSSAKLHSAGLFRFKYGRVVIRAKMPIGNWLFPYLMLQPVTLRSEDPYVSHLRIASVRGNRKLQDQDLNEIGGNVLFGSAVMWSNENYEEYYSARPHRPKEMFGDDYYNYEIIWHETRIIFKVDGLTYGTITDKGVLDYFSREKCFIVLGLAAGGRINFNDDVVLHEQKPFNHSDPAFVNRFFEQRKKFAWEQPSLMIDYIRVYATHEEED